MAQTVKFNVKTRQGETSIMKNLAETQQPIEITDERVKIVFEKAILTLRDNILRCSIFEDLEIKKIVYHNNNFYINVSYVSIVSESVPLNVVKKMLPLLVEIERRAREKYVIL